MSININYEKFQFYKNRNSQIHLNQAKSQHNSLI